MKKIIILFAVLIPSIAIADTITIKCNWTLARNDNEISLLFDSPKDCASKVTKINVSERVIDLTCPIGYTQILPLQYGLVAIDSTGKMMGFEARKICKL